MESKMVKHNQKCVLFAFSVFGTLFNELSRILALFLPFLKGRPCDSKQTLHELARFFGFALLGSKTPLGADFALIFMKKHPILIIFGIKKHSKSSANKGGEQG